MSSDTIISLWVKVIRQILHKGPRNPGVGRGGLYIEAECPIGIVRVDPADCLPFGLSWPFSFIREARVGGNYLLSMFPMGVTCSPLFVLI